jgi:hypothetical protein
MDETAREKFKNDAARLALPVLVERAGGSVTVTADDLAELRARYGQGVGVQIRHHGLEMQLTLVSVPGRPATD